MSKEKVKKYKTEEQKNAFGVGLIVMLILQGGFDVWRLEGWGPYIGILMILFSVICAYEYTKDDPKNKDDE